MFIIIMEGISYNRYSVGSFWDVNFLNIIAVIIR